MSAQSRPSGFRRGLALLALIAAGESVFFLPFVLARIFRPTLLEVFDLTNVQLGTAFSLYGIVGMAAYFLGGPLADRFAPRALLATALVTTAAGGLLMASGPSFAAFKWLFAYWGFTTIALFWSALIKATREWGGESLQGAAFGLLDGGRGLMTAVTGSVVVAIYASLLPAAVETASLAQRTAAFQQIILIMTGITCVAALFVWFTLPRRKDDVAKDTTVFDFNVIKQALRLPSVWLQAIIVVCAYVGFKATDDFSLYAKEVLGFNEVDAARLGLVSLWMRPIGAIGAGLLADRLSAGRMTVLSFGLIATGAAVLATGLIGAGTVAVFLLSIVTASLGIFALRGLYYAIMGEARIPLTITGTAVGVVSVLGYTPDVFMGPLMGALLDGTPGAGGHRQVFAVVAAFAVAGVIASLVFLRLTRGGNGAQTAAA
ncbi:MAG: MFS transporter [Opitutaceae bacterium]|nr:MFS transporter [Cephaloticoccus sp.]MCP5529151.1 MFS transporter [Opitutaceae bacterium]